jgi:hypothetical protein
MTVGEALGRKQPNSSNVAEKCEQILGNARKRKNHRCWKTDIQRSNTQHELFGVVTITFARRVHSEQRVRGILVI